MNAYDCVVTKLDIREFSSRPVPADVKLKILDAARLSGTGMNSQHWRFVLVQEREGLQRLAADSTTGRWVAGADFAVMVLTDPKYGFNLIDAGRAAEDMQIAAWSLGVVSCVFTGLRVPSLRADFSLPAELQPSLVVGFGYPTRKVLGKKNRRPLHEVASLEKYGTRLKPGELTA
jgi:nitroreductase